MKKKIIVLLMTMTMTASVQAVEQTVLMWQIIKDETSDKSDSTMVKIYEDVDAIKPMIRYLTDLCLQEDDVLLTLRC